MKIKNLEDVFRHLPIRGETAFSNTRGKFQEKIKKKQLKYLRDHVEELQHVLEEGEEILLSSTAVSPFKLMEQLTTFGWIYFIKRCLIVLTNRRILHFPDNYRGKPQNSVAQVRFQDIEGLKGKRNITVRYKNGTKEMFSNLKNGKRLVQLLKKLVTASSASSQHGGRQHLCPRCVAPLASNRYTCSRCRLDFKEPGTAALYSIFMPAGGYFYTRHIWIGIAGAAVELALIFFTFVFILRYFTSPQGELRHLFMGLLLGLALILVKTINVFHTRRNIEEYIPKMRHFSRIPQPKPVSRTGIVDPSQERYYEEERVTFE